MTIQHKQGKERGQFFIADGDAVAAEMTYIRQDPTTIIIDHTQVSAALQGKNIGLQLVEAAVEFARQEHLKIIPVCSFASAVFQKKPEFGDVLKEE